MGFVHRQHGKPDAFENRKRLGLREPFGRHIGEPQFAARDFFQDGAVLVKIIGRIEARGGDAVAAKLGHLVAHQGDQRRYDDGKPVAHQRRQLITQRLAAARRHDGEHVAPGEDCFDDLSLAGAKLRKAEHGVQELPGRGKIGHEGAGLRWTYGIAGLTATKRRQGG